MISCCTIHLADIPIGFTRVPFDRLWSNTVRKFLFNHIVTVSAARLNTHLGT